MTRRVADHRGVVVPALLRPRATQERVSGQRPRHQEGHLEVRRPGVHR